MTDIFDLTLKPTELERSKALSQCISQELEKQQGVLPFSLFMELALYHPTWGYYNADQFSLGKDGDFTTAPEISPLFAACFANQLRQVFDILGSSAILELGAGSGKLAHDLLHYLNKLGYLPQHYYIYEISPGLRKKQQVLLQQTQPEFFSRITWLTELPKNFIGTIIANEVLDALTVDCFQVIENGVKERCVISENNEFAWTLREFHHPLLAEKALDYAKEYFLNTGYQSEIHSALISTIPVITNSLKKGVIFFADYGYGQAEYYHPQRNHGSLTCFYQHKKHHNPLILPGLQDITAHVNFTQVIELAFEHGCQLAGYTNQASFLLINNLLNIAEQEAKTLNPVDAFNLNHAIKRLTLPTEMGERIKMMALSKNVEIALFREHDRRRDL